MRNSEIVRPSAARPSIENHSTIHGFRGNPLAVTNAWPAPQPVVQNSIGATARNRRISGTVAVSLWIAGKVLRAPPALVGLALAAACLAAIAGLVAAHHSGVF
jgi:hypothetical protein